MLMFLREEGRGDRDFILLFSRSFYVNPIICQERKERFNISIRPYDTIEICMTRKGRMKYRRAGGREWGRVGFVGRCREVQRGAERCTAFTARGWMSLQSKPTTPFSG